MTKVRVLEIVEATTGGTRRHITDLVCGLDRARFAVSVICSTLRDPGFQGDIRRMRDAGAEVDVVQMVRSISPARDIAAFARILRRVRRGVFDVVHTHSSKAGFLGRLAAGMAGVKTVVHTPHTFAFQMEVGRGRRAFYRRLEKSVAGLTDRYVCVCRSELDAAIEARIASAGKCAIIENGLPAAAFGVARDKVAARCRLGLGPDAVVVGTVGRVVSQKGHSHLVSAAARVIEKRPDVRFVLVGDGPLMSDTRQLIERLRLSENFIVPGAIEGATSLFPAFDVFVLPSLWESLPYSLLDAMAAGNAIVATAVGGVPEALAGGQAGVLVPPSDPSAMAAAILDLLEKPVMRESLGSAAAERARSAYTLEAMISKVESLYVSG